MSLALHSQLTAEQRLQKAIVDITANPKYVALAGVLMVGKRTVIDGMLGDILMPTAATNGRDETYNRKFIDNMNDAELRFVVLHENYHKLYRHLTTWRHLFEEDARCANMACDHVINLKIRDDNQDGFAKPPNVPGICMDDKYKGWDSAQVFYDLKKQQKKQKGGKGKGGAQGQGQGKPQPGDGDGSGEGSFDHHQWEDAQGMTEAEKQQLHREIDEAVRQGALAAGATGSGGERTLEELMKPEIAWQDVLQEFFVSLTTGKDYTTWARPNRKYAPYGIYLPSGVSERVGGGVLAIDTSGSIGQDDLTKMLSEVQGIVQSVTPEYLKVLYWDTQICQEEHYEPQDLEQLVTSTKPEGGGGTNVECVPAFMQEKNMDPDFVVVFTDGYLCGSWGQWTCPVIWCVIDHPECRPPGKTVHISTERLRR